MKSGRPRPSWAVKSVEKGENSKTLILTQEKTISGDSCREGGEAAHASRILEGWRKLSVGTRRARKKSLGYPEKLLHKGRTHTEREKTSQTRTKSLTLINKRSKLEEPDPMIIHWDMPPTKSLQ